MSFVNEAKKVAPVTALTKASYGGFDVLMDSDSSPDQSPRTPRVQPVKAKPEPSAPVKAKTEPSAPVKAKTEPLAPVKAKTEPLASQMDWGIESDDEEEEPVALSVTLSANVTVRTKKRDWADYESDEEW
jgi:hypothetical protein